MANTGVTTKEKRSIVGLILMETVLPFLLFACKSAAISITILELGAFTLPVTALSVFILAVLCLFVRGVLHARHTPTLFVLYSVFCFIFFIDAIYSGYTGKLPSAVMLQYTGQLEDVSDVILENITLTRILYVIDLPLWIPYALYVHPLLAKNTARPVLAPKQKTAGAKRLTGGIALLCAVCVLVGAACCIFTDFKPAYFTSEVLTYHALDIAKLLLPKKQASIDDFGQTLEAGASTSPYFGAAHGRNVITVQLEAFQNFVLGLSYNGQEITPNLNRLLEQDTLYFDRYYYQIGGGNTADAEFAVNNSLYAPETEAAYSKYPDNDYYSMAMLLKDNGYTSATAFHGYVGTYWSRDIAYPGQGFDAFLSGSDYYAEPETYAGSMHAVSDEEFFVRAVDYMKKQEGPFYAFLVSLSSHYSYDMELQYRTLALLPEDEGTLFGKYLQSVHYVDKAIGVFLDALKEAGLYDNSVITFYGDHFGLPVYKPECKAPVSALIGRQYTYAEHFNVPLIIHIPGAGLTETVSHVGGHIDVMPTLLHLLGLENNKSVMFGYNILTTEDGAVYEQTHLGRGSFFKGDMMLEVPFTGIMANSKARNIVTGESLDITQFFDTAKKAQEEYDLCMYLLENNLVLLDRYEEARRGN